MGATVFDYQGDGSNGRIFAYLENRLQEIALCFNSGFPEVCLILIYSAIDTFGFLGAPAADRKATKTSFLDWSEAYLVGRVKDVDGGPILAMDFTRPAARFFTHQRPHQTQAAMGKRVSSSIALARTMASTFS